MQERCRPVILSPRVDLGILYFTEASLADKFPLLISDNACTRSSFV